MGLFKFLGRTFGGAVEWIGEKTGIEPLKTWGRNIQRCLSGNESPYRIVQRIRSRHSYR